MNEIAELERRIAAALERIGQGTEGLVRRPDAGGPEAGDGALARELDEARRLLAAERAAAATAQAAAVDLERRIGLLGAQAAAQAQEIQRLKTVNAELTATLQALRDAAEEGADAALLDHARSMEIEAMRAARRAEAVELDGLLAELRPLIGEAHHA